MKTIWGIGLVVALAGLPSAAQPGGSGSGNSAGSTTGSAAGGNAAANPHRNVGVQAAPGAIAPRPPSGVRPLPPNPQQEPRESSPGTIPPGVAPGQVRTFPNQPGTTPGIAPGAPAVVNPNRFPDQQLSALTNRFGFPSNQFGVASNQFAFITNTPFLSNHAGFGSNMMSPGSNMVGMGNSVLGAGTNQWRMATNRPNVILLPTGRTPPQPIDPNTP